MRTRSSRLRRSLGPLALLVITGACAATPPSLYVPIPAEVRRTEEARQPSATSLDSLLDAAPEGLPTLPPPSGRPHDETADEYGNLHHKFAVSVGAAFLANFDTAVRVDSDFVLGTNIDLEDLLGVDSDNAVFRLAASYEFTPRHRVDMSVFDINRNGSRSIAEDIEIGDVTIPSGSVDTRFDTLVAKAAYRYNFVDDQRTVLGASLGLHMMGITFALESDVAQTSETFRATAPLPVVGLHGEYALSPTWKILASAELFQVDIGFGRGHLSDTSLAIEHEPWKHFGWGLGLNGFRLDADIEGDGPLSADLEYAYQGAFLYLRYFH